MASANLDLVRSIFVGWERGDFRSAEWADPEIEYVFADGPDPGSWTRLAGVADGFRAFLRSWADFRASAEEYHELDDEHVSCSDASAGAARRADWTSSRCK